tara:strand:- start:61 stop:300 length:240 start_codon:yes stop_codon:yes gene_type:complete
MSKKKSYMNVDNILSESLISKMFSLFKRAKGDKNKSLSKVEKKLMKDKSFVKALKDFNKHYDDAMKASKELRKKYGVEK